MGLAEDIDREVLASLQATPGAELTLIPVLSKQKPEPFYGWGSLRITVDRYDEKEALIFDTEGRSFQTYKYNIKSHSLGGANGN